ncbi:MAG: DNA photolyase family protein [Ignavibacteria bacterium]|nr:DNA photolyase family protein [Ignavibacteria bacterium]
MEKVQVLWFRRDLRVEDNPLLSCSPEVPVLPIFIFDKNILASLPSDDRRVTFIFDQIQNLKRKLKDLYLDLAVFYGKPIEVFEFLSHKFNIVAIYASSDNESYSKNRDNSIKTKFPFYEIFDNFLLEPNKIYTQQNKVYQIFTHFKNAVIDRVMSYENLAPFEVPKNLQLINFTYDKIIELEGSKFEQKPFELSSIGFSPQTLKFLPARMEPRAILEEFSKVIDKYDELRNIPSVNGTSKLSVHLRFGTISIRDVLRWASKHNAKSFISELIWREFFNYLLYHFPDLESENFRKNLNINWINDENFIKRWRNAETGIPFVDAGIRELLETGYMHNRVRMVVASFLTKNLHVHWKIGEEFFAKHLLDYEVSSNIGNWQWISGVGTDPRSAYRTFNPFLQSLKFDPNCEYIYKFLPVLKVINPKNIHNPKFLLENSVKGYPKPILANIAKSKLL